MAATTPTALRAMTPEGVPTAVRLAGVLGLAIAGAAGAALVMTQISYGGNPDVARMRATPHWIAWVLILAIQTGIWAALVPAVVAAWRRCKAAWSVGQVLHVAVILALLLLPFVAGQTFETIHDVQLTLRPRMMAFTIVAGLVSFAAIIAIVRSHEEIRALGDPIVEATPGPAAGQERERLEREVDGYLDLRGRIRFLGGALTAIAALAILATGGQRSTIVAMETARASEATAWAATLPSTADATPTPPADPARCDDPAAEASGFAGAAPTKEDCLVAAAEAKARAARFGIEAVWSFGLFYTFALALVYLPPYLSLIEVGRRIRDRHFPASLPGDGSYDVTKKNRAEMNEILKLDTPAIESLRAATLLLVPLVSSVASNLLGGVSIDA